MPKSNTGYWTTKIERNVKRDAQVRSALDNLGWKWRVIWECEIESGVQRISKELGENVQVQEGQENWQSGSRPTGAGR